MPLPPPAPLNSIPRNKVTEAQYGLTIRNPDTPSTEFRSRPVMPGEASFRHGGWAAQRGKVWDSMLRTHRSAMRLERFSNCGAGVYVQLCDATHESRLSCDRCRDRLCLACGRDRAAVMSDSLAQVMDERQSRFVTLTRRHSHAPLSDQITSLFDAFARLRRSKFWLSCITGGAAFLEVKLGKGTGLWHVHLHLIVTGSFIDQRLLSRAWLAVTSDSSIVDVRSIPDAGTVAKYVTKYVTKPCDASIYNVPEKLDEFVVAIQGRRLCLTWGTWRGIKLSEVPDDGKVWRPLCSIWDLRRRVSAGDAEAILAARTLLAKHPDLEVIFGGAGPPAAGTS